jgi:hypothetical protein
MPQDTRATLTERLRAFGADLTFLLLGVLWSLIGPLIKKGLDRKKSNR